MQLYVGTFIKFFFYYLGVVRLTPNVAMRGTAMQSKNWLSNGWATSPFVASYANDGNFDSSMTATGGACSLTGATPPVWWQVDLLKVYEITKVAITGRKEYRKCLFNKYYTKYIVMFQNLIPDSHVSHWT